MDGSIGLRIAIFGARGDPPSARPAHQGGIRGGGIGRMYAHGQCAIVLCEAYALSRDEELREPAQKAIDFIVAAQHKQGGWRYSPRTPGDTSVVGWQLWRFAARRWPI